TTGTFTPTFQVTDSNGLSATRQLTITIGTGVYTISGVISVNTGTSTNGALVKLKLNQLQVAQTFAGSNGAYAFNSVTPADGYVVSASLSGSYFPDSSPINLTGNTTWNIGGVPIYTISGRVTDSGGTGLNGATVALSGAPNNPSPVTTPTVSGSPGDFTLNGIPGYTPSIYTVVASLSGYSFAPKSVTNLSGNQTLADFAPAAAGPNITAISPTVGSVGSVVTIGGNGFGDTPGSVTFNGTPAPT